jgi:hypothetical protein
MDNITLVDVLRMALVSERIWFVQQNTIVFRQRAAILMERVILADALRMGLEIAVLVSVEISFARRHIIVCRPGKAIQLVSIILLGALSAELVSVEISLAQQSTIVYRRFIAILVLSYPL